MKNQLVRELRSMAKRSGFTASLVRRGHRILCTVDPIIGDIVIARFNSQKLGIDNNQ